MRIFKIRVLSFCAVSAYDFISRFNLNSNFNMRVYFYAENNGYTRALHVLVASDRSNIEY